MLNRLLSNDLPRSRVLAVLLVAAAARPGLHALPLPRRQGAQRGGQDPGLHRAGGELRPAAGLHRHRELRAHHVLRHRRLRHRDREHAPGRRAGARCCVGLGAALALSLLLSLAIGLFSLRVRAIFFAMITLAVASAFQTLASQLSDFTGGEDGLTFKMPELLSPSFEFAEEPFLGVSLDGRLLCYYLLFVAARGAGAGAAAHRQLAVRPRAAGDPRERVPRRGDRLPRGGLPHRCRACCRRCSPRWPARCSRSGCATTGRTPRCPSRSCSTCC